MLIEEPSIVTLSPLINTVPPLDEDAPVTGSAKATAVLLQNLEYLTNPKLPSQLIAPPSSPQELFVKLQFSIVALNEFSAMLIAPPSRRAQLYINSEFLINASVAPISNAIAPP